MKSMKTKIVLSALGLALLATPALAQRPRYHATYPQTQDNQIGTYPNPVGHSGSADSVLSGASSDLDRGY